MIASIVPLRFEIFATVEPSGKGTVKSDKVVTRISTFRFDIISISPLKAIDSTGEGYDSASPSLLSFFSTCLEPSVCFISVCSSIALINICSIIAL